MKRLLLLLPFLLLGGCKRGILTGSPDRPDDSSFFILACCEDVTNGVATYPSFLPQSHIDLCQRAKAAPGGKIGNDTYLATQGDCGNQATRTTGTKKIGDEYYTGKGY